MQVPLACWQAGPTLIKILFTDEILKKIFNFVICVSSIFFEKKLL